MDFFNVILLRNERNEPGHSISYKIVRAPCEDSDQSVHPRGLFSLRCPFEDASDSSDPWLPASVAQLDARPTGDQEVAGSTPAGSAKLFLGDSIMKQYFLRSFSPFRWFK